MWSQDTLTPSDTSVDSLEVEQCVFNGEFESAETGVRLHLDLIDESIEIPGMSFLGPTNGYLDGKSNSHVYGVWMVLKYDLSPDGKKVKLRLSNDTGSDSQDILLTWQSDNTLKYEATGNNNIKKVEGGKRLVKIPSTMTLTRMN